MTTTITHPAPTVVRELPDTLTVAVDEEDLLLGKRRNPAWCPIARALRRTLTLMGYMPVGVCVGGQYCGYSTVSIGASPTRFEQYEFRPEGWLTQFDLGEPVQPRSFELVRQ